MFIKLKFNYLRNDLASKSNKVIESAKILLHYEIFIDRQILALDDK